MSHEISEIALGYDSFKEPLTSQHLMIKICVLCKQVPAQPVDATPSDINLFSKGGVHDAARRWKLSAAQRADMWSRWKAGQSLNAIGRALGKDHSGHSVSVGASRGDRSACSSPFAAGTHLGRTRRHLPRNRQRLLDAGHRPTSESRLLHGKPGGGPPWRARAVSSQRSRSAGLGVGPAAQAVPAGHPQQAATDRCE